MFGKGDRTRIVPLPGSIWNHWAQVAGEERDAPVFRSANGRPLSPITPWRIVKAAARRAGLPDTVACHHLRHSHASHALDHGCPVHVLQVVLGHASLVTTSRYVHVGSNESSADYLQDESVLGPLCVYLIKFGMSAL